MTAQGGCASPAQIRLMISDKGRGNDMRAGYGLLKLLRKGRQTWAPGGPASFGQEGHAGARDACRWAVLSSHWP